YSTDGAAKKAPMDLINGCAFALQWSAEARDLRKIKFNLIKQLEEDKRRLNMVDT
ncbi:hypothetical protein INT46_005180, partial [Mucor plumbeus]